MPIWGRGAASGKRNRIVDDRAVGTVPTSIAITNKSIPGMVPTGTWQLSWDILSGGVFLVNHQSDPVSFSTSDGGIATVSATGLITAVGAGTATITITLTGPNVRDTVDVVVAGSVTPDGVTASPTSLSGNPTQVRPLNFTIDDGGVPLTGRTATATSTNTGVATVSAVNSAADPSHLVNVTMVADGTCNILLGDSVQGVLASIGVVVSTAVGVQPDFVEDFSTYTGGDDATKTVNFMADQRNCYRAGEDKPLSNLGLHALVSGEGLGGGMGHVCTYPSPQSTNFTVSRSFDLSALFGTGGQTGPAEIWWEMTVKFSEGFTTVDPGNPGGNGFKWMHGDVVPNTSRFGLAINEGQNQNRVRISWPDNEQGPFINGFDCATMFTGGASHTFRVHYKCGNGDGIVGVELPNGVKSIHSNIVVNRTNLFKLAICQNLNEKAAGVVQSVTYQRTRLWLTDPGWGI